MHPLGASLKCDYCGTVVVPDRDTSGVRVLAETTRRPGLPHLQCPA